MKKILIGIGILFLINFFITMYTNMYPSINSNIEDYDEDIKVNDFIEQSNIKEKDVDYKYLVEDTNIYLLEDEHIQSYFKHKPIKNINNNDIISTISYSVPKGAVRHQLLIHSYLALDMIGSKGIAYRDWLKSPNCLNDELKGTLLMWDGLNREYDIVLEKKIKFKNKYDALEFEVYIEPLGHESTSGICQKGIIILYNNTFYITHLTVQSCGALETYLESYYESIINNLEIINIE